MSGVSCRSPKTVITESQIHGRGLFTRAPIAKGEIVAIKGRDSRLERWYESGVRGKRPLHHPFPRRLSWTMSFPGGYHRP
jgi:SET domain-containing protein